MKLTANSRFWDNGAILYNSGYVKYVEDASLLDHVSVSTAQGLFILMLLA